MDPNPLNRDGTFTDLDDEVLAQMPPEKFDAYLELREAFACNQTAEDNLKVETALQHHNVDEVMRLKSLMPQLSAEDRRGLEVKAMIASNAQARLGNAVPRS